MLNTRYLQLCPQQIVQAGQKTETQLKHSSVCLICTCQMAGQNALYGPLEFFLKQLKC